MIRLGKKEIWLAPPQKGVLEEDEIPPLKRKLVFGHLCPHCGAVIQALLETDRPLEEVVQDHFELKEPVKIAKLATSTELHQVHPKYTSLAHRLQDGTFGQLLLEEYHFGISNTKPAGICPYGEAIFRETFDMVYYVRRMINVETAPNWHPIWEGYLEQFKQELDKKEDLAEALFEEIKSRVRVAADVTGKGAPVWLMSRQDWSSYVLATAIKKVAHAAGIKLKI